LRIVQYSDGQTDRVGVVAGDTLIDLTATPAASASVHDLYYRCGGAAVGFPAAVERLTERGSPRPAADLDDPGGPLRLRPPVTAPTGRKHLLRIWLAGVTHEDSAKLREIEARQSTGQGIDLYDRKYRECAQGGIPELFPKTDPDSLVAHREPIARPPSTIRLVPETELVSVYGLGADGQIERIGFTGGNDYTDNGIEAANPLNLPQAKNWSGGCASLGPALVTDDAFDHQNVAVSCEVLRAGARVARKEGHTGAANLNMPDGLFHLERSLFERIPLGPEELQILFWGTSIVFSDTDLADGLLAGDRVLLSFEGLGALENIITAYNPPDQLTCLRK